jgi:hypothetical protein
MNVFRGLQLQIRGVESIREVISMVIASLMPLIIAGLVITGFIIIIYGLMIVIKHF